MLTLPSPDSVAESTAPLRVGTVLVYARAALSKRPDDPAGLRALAWARLQQGRAPEALAAARDATHVDPGHAAGWHLVGSALLELGRAASAARALARARDLDPSQRSTWDALALALRRSRRLEEAREVLQVHLAQHPNHAPGWAQRAALDLHLRDPEDARRAARRALDQDPDQHEAAYILVRLDEAAGRDRSALDRLNGLLTRPLPTRLRITVGLHRARLLDASGQPAEAWSSMATTQQLRRATPAFARSCMARWPGLLTSVRAWCTDHAPATAPPSLYPTPPVFVVGFPRSGTTLVQTLLDAHAGLSALDERPLLARLAGALDRLLGRPCRYPQDLHTLTLQERATLIEAWARMIRRLGIGPGRIVDKMPLNIAWLPLAWTLFPDARVVLAVRDPRDAILSALFQDLEVNDAMVHLADPSTSAALYDQVMATWETVRALPGLSVYEQRYEDLVADPTGTLRALCRFIDEPFDPEMLRAHTHAARTPVSTPSADAVTRPIHARSAGRWRRHTARLAPIQPVLARWVDRFGYEAPDEDVPTASDG